MKGLVLDIITSYENRILTVEELITTAYQATTTSEQSFSDLDKERERLKASLQGTLAKNCSLRRKDFNHLMKMVLDDSERKRVEIEEEQKCLRESVREYLKEQKELASSLKQQIVEQAEENTDKGKFDAAIHSIKTMYQETGQQLIAVLRESQSHTEAFQREQEEINNKLRRLVDRGESLKIEDLRQLEAAKAREGRKAERELRRQDVERLLAHFKQQRQESSRGGDRQLQQIQKGGQ
jgi:predicted transcriptional regulator